MHSSALIVCNDELCRTATFDCGKLRGSSSMIHSLAEPLPSFKNVWRYFDDDKPYITPIFCVCVRKVLSPPSYFSAERVCSVRLLFLFLFYVFMSVCPWSEMTRDNETSQTRHRRMKCTLVEHLRNQVFDIASIPISWLTMRTCFR